MNPPQNRFPKTAGGPQPSYTYEQLHALKMPVYLCGGLYDGIATPENLKAMQKQIPGARMELFEGGHLFTFKTHERSTACGFSPRELDG